MDLFLDLLSFGCCCCSDAKLLFIMQATMTSPLHASGVNFSFSYGTYRNVWEGNFKMDLQEVLYGVRAGSSWLRIGTGGALL